MIQTKAGRVLDSMWSFSCQHFIPAAFPAAVGFFKTN